MLLTKDQIVSGLKALDAKARSASQTVDMAIYGGASLALAFNMNMMGTLPEMSKLDMNLEPGLERSLDPRF